MIVLDCSAAVSIIMGKPAGNILQNRINEGEAIIAPDLYLYELCSTLRKYYFAGAIDESMTIELYDSGTQLVEKLYGAEGLAHDVLTESLRLNHSPYDIAYLVLAKRSGAALMTLDRKLAQLCDENEVDCITVAA